MSTDILRMLSSTDTPRFQPSSSNHRLPPAQDVAARQGRAASGERLPQTMDQDTANEAAKVEHAVSQVNEFVQNLNRDLQFTVDDDSGRTVIKVLDNETKEVIRQIPPEELLRIANYLLEADGSSLLLQVQA